MKRDVFQQVVATLVLVLGAGAGAGAVSRSPVAVVSRARIDKGSVTLADLLPVSAPNRVRARAALVSLGSAPLPGGWRRISRSEIEGRLGDKLARELAIPESVVVERQARELSRQEVFAAIRAALVRGGFAGVDELGPEDVRLGMPVMITAENAGLLVLGMNLDPTLHKAVFRLWTAKDKNVRPFDVMVRPVGGLETWLERETGEMPASDVARRGHPRGQRESGQGTAWQPRKPQGKPLVMAWQPASLLLISKAMEIHTTVEPLERGYLGQVIRVRMAATKQIFRAKVVAPSCLEARF